MPRARIAARGVASGLPSGRTEYRQYVDFTDELDALATANPDIAREVTIGTSLEGRPIQGIEIAADVDATDDGRPVYVQLGAHHAREWPSAELPMEFAIDLVTNYGTDARITELLDEVRVLVVPVVNVDGFLASRSFGTSPLDDDQVATLPDAAAGANAYRRKNCRPISPADALIPCAMRTSGVDLNRNYGYYWGGPGSSSDPTSSGFRGALPTPSPSHKPSTSSRRGIHPTVFISNHTFTDEGLWLRQPGFDAPFLPQDSIGATTPDEVAMKDLGDDMEGATGWRSERGYESLGDITGATEDWNYFAQGSYGYTPEVRGLNFHANYQDSVIEEYVGDAAHPGLGAREAYLIAGERAADRAEHSLIQGAGARRQRRSASHKEFEVPLHPDQGEERLVRRRARDDAGRARRRRLRVGRHAVRPPARRRRVVDDDLRAAGRGSRRHRTCSSRGARARRWIGVRTARRAADLIRPLAAGPSRPSSARQGNDRAGTSWSARRATT